MPRYSATISLPGNVYETEVSGSYFANAMANLARREGCSESQIYNMKEIRENKSSGGNSGSGEISDGNMFWGGIALALVAFGAAVAFLGPIFTGPAAAFVAYKGIKKVTGNDKTDYQDAIKDHKSASKSVLISLVLIILAGGWGAVTGYNLQQDAWSDDAPVEQIAE